MQVLSSVFIIMGSFLHYKQFFRFRNDIHPPDPLGVLKLAIQFTQAPILRDFDPAQVDDYILGLMRSSLKGILDQPFPFTPW